MATVSKTRTYSTGSNITASNYNDDRDEIIAGVNDITNAQINANAGIATTKISGTAVTLAGSESLSNKTLVKPTVTASLQTLKADTDGSTITFDLDESNIHSVTLGGNRILALDNADAGQAFVIRLTQDGTGSRTVTWFSTIKWAGGSAPTLTTTAGATDVFGFICTSGGNYDGYIVGFNLS